MNLDPSIENKQTVNKIKANVNPLYQKGLYWAELEAAN